MFGNRCLGLPGCGHSTNWTCPCTCEEEIDGRDREPAISRVKLSQQAEAEAIKIDSVGIRTIQIDDRTNELLNIEIWNAAIDAAAKYCDEMGEESRIAENIRGLKK